MSRVLVIADLHLPFTIDGYLEFLIQQYQTFNCDEVVFIGDEIDFHAISDWDSEYDALSPLEENNKSKEMLRDYVQAFPNAKCVWANHTNRIVKKIQRLGFTLEEAAEIYKYKFGLQSWDFKWEHVIDGVLYMHTSPSGGVNSVPAMSLAMAKRMPVVAGHIHHAAGVKFSNNGYSNIWAMNTGSALDEDTYAARYGINSKFKGVAGCGIVLNGTFPIYVPFEQ